MAKIYGIEIKGTKNFRGHDGEDLTQGNVYMDGQKIGFYSEGNWGGENSLEIELPPSNASDLKALIKKRKDILAEVIRRTEAYLINTAGTIDPYSHLDGTEMFYPLLLLLDKEKDFKRETKKGKYKHLTYYNMDGLAFNQKMYVLHSIEDKGAVETHLKNSHPDKNPRDFEHFYSLKDFIIEEPKTEEQRKGKK